MADWHRLLKRQLKQRFGSKDPPPELRALLDVINQAYHEFDQDRLMLERSMEISSKELYQANTLLTATLNSTSDGILVVDSAGKAILFNDRFGKMWGIPQDILVSRNDERMIESVLDKLKDPAFFLQKVKQLYLSKATDTDLIYLKDGRIFERFSAPLIQNGQLYGRVWDFRDITELKRTQDQLIQSEKMSAVGQLAAGVAHEINNPLGVILGFAQGMVKRLRPGDPTELPLTSIEREAQRCKVLVQNLLMFSRSGKTEKEELDINETIESSLSLITARAKVKNIQLTKELGSGIPKFFANRGQIQQVIVNLSNNAMDAMPEGGTLTVRTRKISLKSKEAVEIEVSDTGHGIPKDIQSKIFEPFFTTKEVGKGTGLGLSLVFEIIQKHEGKITVDSEPKKGTTFKIHLPF